MLARTQRLSAAEVESVMKKGRIVHSPLFQLRTAKRTAHPVATPDKAMALSPAAIAAIVPVKVAKKATERTHLRRLMYEAIRTISIGIAPATQTLVLAKEPVKKATFQEISAGIKDIFVKAGLLK